jgi:hypothetical protein
MTSINTSAWTDSDGGQREVAAGYLHWTGNGDNNFQVEKPIEVPEVLRLRKDPYSLHNRMKRRFSCLTDGMTQEL